VAMAALDAAQFKDVDTTDCRLVNFTCCRQKLTRL
jgi:hypothetical protein